MEAGIGVGVVLGLAYGLKITCWIVQQCRGGDVHK